MARILVFSSPKFALQSADEGEFTTEVTEDYREGVKAFLEKRPPVFEGK